MKGKRVGRKECYNGEAERNVVGAFEKEIMSRARVEFRQDKGERILPRQGRESEALEEDGRSERITVEWAQLEGEGVGGDGRHQGGTQSFGLLCSAWLVASLAGWRGEREEPIH